MSLAFRQLRCLLLVIAASLGLSAAEGTGSGLLAAYYANETLSGSPMVSRTDAQVNFAWSGGAPASGMPVDSFSARWEGEVEARFTENLTLIARTDDGVRMWLDGQLVIDAWVLRSAADSSYTFAAEAGRKHRIRLEYYEHFGSAVAQLLWQSASIPRAAIPVAYLYPSPAFEPPFGTGTGLLARYYANETLSGSPVLIRNDARVDFGWGGGSPDGSVPVESFSARWDGEIEARVSEPLTIIARTDDGVRVWINGQVVIDQWVLRSAADSAYTFSAEAGQRYRIRMEYYEHTGAAVARLWWQSANEPKGPIPTSQLYPTDPVDPPNGTGTGLLASYFANETLSGTPVLSRTEARVDHNWGGSSPGAGVPVDVFSARWLGEIEPRTSEPLTIIARTDDGVRLWIDGQLVIDQWILRGAADSTYTFSAEAGRRYSIRMEYFEHYGSAVAKLWWQSATEPKAPIPTSQLYPTEPAFPPAGTGTGLFATYFANETLTGDPILSRVEPRIDHNWGGGSPGSPVPVDVFSARWEGEIEPRFSETLTLIARTDDGVRVWLNDAPVIDAWILRGAADSTYAFTAVAGQRYRIRMEYFEHYGSAVAKLWWQSANEPKGPIPTSQLYPITGTPTTPTIAFVTTATTVAEDAGSTSVAVALSQAIGTDVTVAVQSSGSGATAPATLLIPAGSTTVAVPVTISDDPRFGPDRQVTLSLADPIGANLGLATSHLLTIQNTDAAPTIAFTTPTSFNLEQSGTASVIVRLSAVSAQTTTVAVTLSGSASAGGDYQAPSATLQIPADTFEGTIFIPLLADSDAEQDETIILTLSAPVGAILGSPTVHTITLSDGNQSPVIANGPTPTVNPVMGTSVGLSFSATDDGGAANLGFTWSTVGTVPAPVSFSPATGSVGTTSTTTAAFTEPGIYTIQVQVRDAYLATATAQTTITVQSTPAVITVSPSTATVSVLGTQSFTAAGVDQFGTAVPQPLPVAWSVTGGGSIATNGVFTAGTSAGGPFTVLATLPSAQGNAAITVIDQAPTLVQGPTATVDAAATGLVLTALATDDGGEATLTYQWSVEGTAPGTVQFAANGSNAAKSTTATLSAIGTYVLRLTATDGANQAVSATASITVDPVLGALVITPATAAIGTGATQDFTISGTDQFNAAVTNPTATWMVSGGGTIATTANGARFTAGSEAGGPHTITASSGARQATAEVTILSAPVISQQPQSQSVLTGETATFSVTAVGAAPLTYVWQVSTDAGATWQAVVGDGTGTSYQTPTLSLADHNSRFRVTVSNPAGTAPSDEAVLSVAKRVQTITFNALPSKLVSDAPFTLTGTASSGLAVTYHSSDPGVASISGTTVTIHTIGTTTITAEQAGDDLWQAAEPVPQVLSVTPVPKQPQTITFNSLPTKTVGDAPFELTASASSGLPVSYVSSNAAVATVDGATVTILATGTTTITASQPGDAIYDAALSVDQPLTVVGRPAPVVSYVTSNTAKATLIGTYPADIGINGIEVTILDPATVISFAGEVSGGVFQVEVDNATPAVAQVTVALAFRFGDEIGPQVQRTVPFGAQGGGGGDYEDGSPNGIPPFPPKVTLVIESGLTGKQMETINNKELHFTQNTEVTVRVHTRGTYSPISSIIVTSSDGQSVPAENGVATFPTPIEGAWELSAIAVATNDWGTASGSTEEATHLIVDRTEPKLLHVLPSRYWPSGVTQPPNAPPPAVPLRHGLDDERTLVRLNGNDTGTNTTLRNQQWLNVFDHAGYTGEAQVDDLSGLRTDVTQSGEAKDRQGFPTDITITVRSPINADRGDPQTILLQGFANLADSVEYSGINESNRRGLHRMAVTLEDRAGNRLESHDEYDLWVQTKAPEAKFAIRMGASAYAIDADETQLSPARFIFTSADIEEGWQDSRDEANRLQLLGRSENGPRLWLLKTPKPVPPDNSASVNVILRDRAGGISEPVSVTVSRQVLHEDLGQSLSEGPLPWFAKETYYDFETPLFRDAGTSPTDEFMWSIPDNDRLAVPLGPHRGNVEGKFTMTRNGEIPYDPEHPEYGGYPAYKVSGVTVAGNKGYVEHTHLNVSPLDVGDGDQRRFAPAVITIPPSWKQDPPNVTVRIRDQGIAPVRALGQLLGTITLADVKTPSQPDGIFDLTQGTDTNSITAEIDLRRTINDPDAGPVAPGQPIPQISAAQPGFNAVQYVVSVGESGSGEYVQVTPYTGNAAYRWMNLIRLSPDIVATGTRATIRIEAGFLTDEIGFSNFQATSGDYVNFYAGGTNITETRSDYEAHKNDPVRPKNKISIVGQRLTAVGRGDAPQGSVQALELDLVVGPEVVAGLVDVDVKFGAVKAYTDDLSTAHANEETGAHRMTEALALIGLRYETQEQRNATEIPKSRSIPRLTVNGWGASRVTINGESATVSLAGEIQDSIADLVQNSIMKKVHVYHEGTLVGSIPLQVASDDTSDWKPFAKHFTFSGSVGISAWEGVHRLELVSDANEMGVEARTSMTVSIVDASISPTPFNTLLVDCLLEPTVSIVDHLTIIWPSPTTGIPGEETLLTETGVDSGIYENVEQQVRLELRSITGVRANITDVLVATITQAGQSLNQSSDSLVEIGTDSKRFSVTLFNPNQVSVYEVTGTTGPSAPETTEEGWSPYRIRLDGPTTLIDKIASERKWYLNTVEVQMEKVGESWYVKTNPPRVMVDGEFTPIIVDVDPGVIAPEKLGADLVYSGNIGGITVIVAIDPEKNKDDLPLPEELEAQLIVAKDPADGKLRAKIPRMGYGEKKWITTRSLDGVSPGTFSGTLTRQKAINVAANAVGINDGNSSEAVFSQNAKNLMSDKLIAWTLVEDHEIGGTNWVWNIKENQALPPNPPLWTIPQLASAPEGNALPLGSAVVAALKNNGTVGNESDRMLIECIVVQVAAGRISHWGREEAVEAYEYFSGHVVYTSADAAAIPEGSKVGDFKPEYIKAGVFDFDKALREFNLSNENKYEERRKKQIEMAQAAGWKFDKNVTLADAANQSLSAMNQVLDPFTFCSSVGGGQGVVLPPRQGATWSAVAWEGGWLIATVLTAGTASRGKMALRYVKNADDLPAGHLPPRAVTSEEVIVRNAGRICFVAGTKVRTPGGHEPIETIRPGALVWSRSDKTDEEGWKPVIRTFVTYPDALTTVTYSSPTGCTAEITGTPQHRFWMFDSQSWVDMGDLKPGDRLQLDNGDLALVSRVDQKSVEGISTYNFEVADWHTYFVAGNGDYHRGSVWVHNEGDLCSDGIARAREIYSRRGEDLFRHIDIPDWQKALIRENPPRRVPGGGLEAHESIANGGLHPANGHTITKHATPNQQALLDRMMAEGKPEVSAYFSKDIAEYAIVRTLEKPQNAQELAVFMADASKKKIVLKHEMPFSVGHGIKESATGFSKFESRKVRLVIVKDTALPQGWRILTSYVDP